MNKILSTMALCAFLCVGVVGSSMAGCTTEEATAKAQKINEKMQEVAMNNPEKLQEVSERWQKIAQEMASKKDVEEICAAYDELLADL